MNTNEITSFSIQFATKKDVPVILAFIKELADYEKLLPEVVATESILRETFLFIKIF